MTLLNELWADRLNEAKNYMDETEYSSWSSWRAACRKMFGNECEFEGDKDIAQAMVGKMAVGEWDGSVGVLFSHVHKKDGAVVVKEGRDAPKWFKNGAKVKLRKDYEDPKSRGEVFTLNSVDDEEGDGRISDENGEGWTVEHWKVYPASMKSEPLDESAELQGVGKALAGKAAPAEVTEPADDAPAPDDAAPEAPAEPDEMATDEPAAFKVGDIVKPLKGPHKGEAHEVIHVFDDGSMNIRPKDLEASAVKYRLGAAKAQADEVTLAEGVKILGLFTKGSLLANIAMLSEMKYEANKFYVINRKNLVRGGPFNTMKEASSVSDKTAEWTEVKSGELMIKYFGPGTNEAKVQEGRNDTMMPLSYRARKGHTVEAYGRKGMKNTMWRKMFKSYDALNKWCEDNDATCEGSRDLEPNEQVSESKIGTVPELFDISEGLMKSLKRGVAGWKTFDEDGPKELVARNKAYDTDKLKLLQQTDKKTGKGSPAELQQKVISRELKKRGVSEGIAPLFKKFKKGQIVTVKKTGKEVEVLSQSDIGLVQTVKVGDGVPSFPKGKGSVVQGKGHQEYMPSELQEN